MGALIDQQYVEAAVDALAQTAAEIALGRAFVAMEHYLHRRLRIRRGIELRVQAQPVKGRDKHILVWHAQRVADHFFRLRAKDIILLRVGH